MQSAQTFLRRMSSVSAATASRWVRLLLISVLAAALFSSLTDVTAPLSAVHAAPTSSSAHNAGPMKSHAPDLSDESAWFQLKHIGTHRPSANARAVALTKAASLPHSRFGQASQVRSGGKNGTSAQTQVAAAGAAPAPNSGGWTPLGPAPEVTGQGVSDSGRITSIAVNPQNSNDIWIGSADGGVWNSLDGGTSWVPMTDTQQTLSVGSMAIDPDNPNIIYVGTGEANFNPDGFWGVGILKSTDHGQTWTQYFPKDPTGKDNLFLGLTIGKIIIDPSNTNILLAAVSVNTSADSTHGGGFFSRQGYLPAMLAMICMPGTRPRARWSGPRRSIRCPSPPRSC